MPTPKPFSQRLTDLLDELERMVSQGSPAPLIMRQIERGRRLVGESEDALRVGLYQARYGGLPRAVQREQARQEAIN